MPYPYLDYPEEKIKSPQPPAEKYPQIPPTEGIPPELEGLLGQTDVQGGQPSLLGFVAWWNATDPQGLYEIQLIDYLRDLVNKKTQEAQQAYDQALSEPLGKFDTEESRINEAQDKLDAALKKITKMVDDTQQTIKFYKYLGQPIENMPFYKDLQSQGITYRQGTNVQNAFNEFRQQRVMEQQATEQQQRQVEEQYRRGELKAKGQEAQGQAEAMTLGSQRYHQAETAARKPEPAWQRGMGANPALTEEEAKRIFPEQIPVPGTGTIEKENLLAQINNARQIGINTTGYEQALRDGSTPAAIVAAAVNLNDKIKEVNMGNMARQSQILAAQFPDSYNTWLGDMEKSYGGVGMPAGTESTFYKWATAKETEDEPLSEQQKAFQQKRKSTELDMWRKYGDFYGGYSDYLQTTTPEEYKPIEKWIEDIPQVKLAWEQRNMPSRQPYAQWR